MEWWRLASTPLFICFVLIIYVYLDIWGRLLGLRSYTESRHRGPIRFYGSACHYWDKLSVNAEGWGVLV